MSDNRYNEFWADRMRRAWLMRMDGVAYKDIAAQLGVCTPRARQIVMKADKRIADACRIDFPDRCEDPITYGITHTYVNGSGRTSSLTPPFTW